MAVTIRDVARQAGVSISTVSRVLNNPEVVREEKRRRVLKAVERLGYRPNPLARSLLKKTTGGLGVLVPFVSGEFFSEFLHGIDQTAREAGFFVLISTSHHDRSELRVALQSLERRVDGFLLMMPTGDLNDIQAFLPRLGPAVFVNTPVGEGDPVDQVQFDNFGGYYELTRHVLSLGHRRVAILRGPVEASDARERLAGFRKAMAEVPDAEPIELASTLEGYSQEAGYEMARAALEHAPRPTALMAANDQAALGVLAALSEAGVKVPEEMSVTGFDDISGARYTVPALTTARVPVREIGAAAVRQLVARVR
ncbi:MAG: LacI family transcriptional regulator, partial [Bacteroidetes bacterium]